MAAAAAAGRKREHAAGGRVEKERTERDKRRVSRKARSEPRYETQCWGRFFGGGVPNNQVDKQTVWRDYFAFFAHNLSISDSKQNLNCRSF